jgi:hypothetical protein
MWTNQMAAAADEQLTQVLDALIKQIERTFVAKSDG